MTDGEFSEPEMFIGDWRQIDGSVYASYVIPSRMPTWLPFYINGLLGIVLAFVIAVRYPAPPCAVVVYKTKRFRSWRTPVVFRREFETLAAANRLASEFDRELSLGNLPEELR